MELKQLFNQITMKYKRKDNEPPLATGEWGWRFHHIGIPTSEKHDREEYLPKLKLYVTGFEDSPFGVEWMRFEPGSKVHELISKVAHVAFEVKDIEKEISEKNLEIISGPDSPSEGIRVVFIEHNGAPVELIQFQS
jgi:hypothetical protein